jgi:class 3 adenylate cyclase
MHSGINTGLAVIGNRDPEAGTHGVVGDVVNVASRLSGRATSSQQHSARHFWRDCNAAFLTT